LQEQRPPFTSDSELSVVLSGISPSFDGLSQSPGQVIHVLLTRAPVYSPSCPDFLPRLACLRHAASVRSEPGSNSPCKLILSSSSARLPRRTGWIDRNYKINQRNRTGLDPHSIPAARLKACTTIQFSKTGARRGKRKQYRWARALSIQIPLCCEFIMNSGAARMRQNTRQRIPTPDPRSETSARSPKASR
jgi:hypothetical protein